MARTKGMLNLSGNLEVNAGAPLDARTVVPTVADLTNASNFQYKYIGMPVVVQATGDMYILTANDVTVAANWKQVGSGGGGSSYTAGDGIDITNDEISVKAGSNLSFDSSGNLNATDTTYTAGTGIDITNNVISATGGGGTSYTAGDGIVIDNDEISIDEMASADMAEIVTPLPSIPARYQKYSTDEQVVGEWIDGKPIYQKVIVNNASIGTGDHFYNHEINNLDKVISAHGWCNDKNGYMQMLPSASTNTNYMISLSNWSATQYYLSPASGMAPITNSHIIVQYTKTTD